MNSKEGTVLEEETDIKVNIHFSKQQFVKSFPGVF